jgi:hypothetical protein
MKTYHLPSVPRWGASIERTFRRLGAASPVHSNIGVPGFRPGRPKAAVGRRTMRRVLAAFAVLTIVFSTSQVVGMERTPPKRQVQSAAAVQARPSDRVTSSRKVSASRTISATSDFRAEDLIPDICKGCSS